MTYGGQWGCDKKDTSIKEMQVRYGKNGKCGISGRMECECEKWKKRQMKRWHIGRMGCDIWEEWSVRLAYPR